MLSFEDVTHFLDFSNWNKNNEHKYQCKVFILKPNSNHNPLFWGVKSFAQFQVFVALVFN